MGAKRKRKYAKDVTHWRFKAGRGLYANRTLLDEIPLPLRAWIFEAGACVFFRISRGMQI
jgi:hypothetical protein